MDVHKMGTGQTAGLCHYAQTSAYIGIQFDNGDFTVIFNEDGNSQMIRIGKTENIWFRSVWGLDGVSRFSYSTDGENYLDFGNPYQFTWGNYRGTRVGVFTFNNAAEKGHVDIDYFEYVKE